MIFFFFFGTVFLLKEAHRLKKPYIENYLAKIGGLRNVRRISGAGIVSFVKFKRGLFKVVQVIFESWLLMKMSGYYFRSFVADLGEF